MQPVKEDVATLTDFDCCLSEVAFPPSDIKRLQLHIVRY